MLTPEYLDVCVSDLVAIYSELDQSILALIAARIAKTKFVGDASKWQIERLQEAGLLYEEVIAAIARYSGISQEELRKMFAAAGVETITADNAIYTKAGLHPTGIKQSPAMTQVLRAGLKKTGGSLKNLTMTTAMTAQTAYINASNLAYMQITSGAMSMPEAVRHAVRSAAKQGTTVRYPSGHTDQLDVAVRRASVTGVNQTCAQIQLTNAEDMGCNHVETTAHIGARPSHAEWQGRVFMIVGSSREYPNLAEATGYGTGDGLCGWNCRHNFFPFFEGIDLRTYRDEDLEKLKNDGYYEAEQRQRKLERDVRATRRELAGYDAAIAAATDEKTRAALQQEFDRASVKLKKQEGKLKDWIKEKELTPDPSRVQVNGFGRSVSQKAVWANKKALQNAADGGIIKMNDSGTALHSISDETIKNLPEINVFKDRAMNQAVRGYAQELLREAQRHKVGTEVGGIITLDKEMKRHKLIIGEEGAMTVDIPKCKQSSVTLHNHASGETFSKKDILKFVADEQARCMFVVGNNGAWYALQKADSFNWIKFGIDSYPIDGADDFNIQILERAGDYGLSYFQISG